MDNTKEFTAVEFCAGYGGIHLGLKRVIPNLRVIAISEIEAFAIANLVTKMEAGLMDPAPIWTDLKTFPCEPFRDRVDLLVAGYPCQPFSHAGQRKGQEDPRHLWPSIQRAIRLIQPRYCFFENVEGHLTLGFKDVCHDLDELGYEVTAGLFTAAECGAPHKRKRLFILAHSIGAGLQGHTGDGTGCSRQEREVPQQNRPISGGGIQLENAKSLRSGKSANGKRCATSRFNTSNQAWPSRPGEPQYGWEPPRVVEDAGGKRRRGRDNGNEGGDSGEVQTTGPCGALGNTEKRNERGEQECGIHAGQKAHKKRETNNHQSHGPSESGKLMANTERPDKERGQSTGSETPRRRSHGESGGSDIQQDGEIKSRLGLRPDECPSGVGAPLISMGLMGYNIKHENTKTCAREILQALWKYVDQKKVQRDIRGLWSFLTEAILQSGLRLDCFPQRINFFIWATQAGYSIQGKEMPEMWLTETARNTPQRWEPSEQFKKELEYAMCVLSYQIALERGKKALERTGEMQDMRGWCEAAWVLSEALVSFPEIWKSTFDEETWTERAYFEATSSGRNRTDELRLLGNGVVPAVAAKAWQVLYSELQEKTQ